MSEGYNGWSNWETWNVALWLGNDEYHYHATRHFWRAEQFEEYVRDFVADMGGFGDLEPDDIDSVDWEELAQSYSEEGR
jgi:hypothetical protein